MNTIYTNKSSEPLNWGILSTYRKPLLGFSAILVILYHFTADLTYSSLPYSIRYISHWLYACAVPMGVGTFLFLSGFGLYFSMQNRKSLRVFFRSRFLPLLTPYLILGILYWPINDLLIRHCSIRRLVADFSLISFWLFGEHSFWYIATVIVFFLIYPLVFRALCSENRFRYLNYIIILLIDALICFLLKSHFPNCYNNIEICLLRFPVFLTGTLYGDKIYHRKKFSKIDLLLMATILLLKFIVVFRFSTVGYTPWVYQRVLNDHYSVVILVLFAMFLEKLRLFKLKHFLTTVSVISLELYMTHLSIWDLMGFLNIYGPLIFSTELALAIILSLAIHKLSRLIQSWYLDHIPAQMDSFLHKSTSDIRTTNDK